MITPIKDINLNDFTESIPVFLTIIIMPSTDSATSTGNSKRKRLRRCM